MTGPRVRYLAGYSGSMYLTPGGDIFEIQYMNDIGHVQSTEHSTSDQWINHMLSHMMGHMLCHMGTPHAEQQAQAAVSNKPND